AFDAQFNQQHRPGRPVPSGGVRLGSVWLWGLSWLALGVVSLSSLGRATAVLTCLLALGILIYDAVHKIFAFSPVLMATCRFFLILVAASAAKEGVTGGTFLSIWSALGLAAYLAGIRYLAQQGST